MSSDERRGTEGGEHPLDVDARFADIVAHFHDGEPAPPRVVDDGDVAHGATASLFATHADGEDDLGERRTGEGALPDGDPVLGTADGRDHPDPAALSGSPADRREPADVHGGWDSRADEAATDWAARYEQAAREELAAHEERMARRAREAQVEAEVDRAVDGVDSRFVPAVPPPLPRPADLPGRLAWGAVLLGPVALVLFALLWRTAPPWLVGAVVTAIVAGFSYLVWRLPRTHDRDDGGDGAIV